MDSFKLGIHWEEWLLCRLPLWKGPKQPLLQQFFELPLPCVGWIVSHIGTFCRSLFCCGGYHDRDNFDRA